MAEVIVDGVVYVPKKEPTGYVVTPPYCFKGADETAVGDAIYDWLNRECRFGVWQQIGIRFRQDK